MKTFFLKKSSLFFTSLFLLGLLFQLFCFQYGRDQAIYSVAANSILEGGAPYKDVWDFKSPGIFFIYAFSKSVLGSSQHSIRLLEGLSFISLIWAFSIFTRRYFGSSFIGFFGGVFALLNHVQLGFWETAQPESFGAVFLAWALVCVTTRQQTKSTYSPRETICWFLSGILCASAGLLKPTLGFCFVVLLGTVLYPLLSKAKSEKKTKHITAVVLSFFSGAALIIFACGLFFMNKGALSDLYNTFFVFVPGYVSLNFSLTKIFILLLKTLKHWIFSFSIMNAAGLVMFCAFFPSDKREREGGVHLIGIIGVLLFGVLLQAKFFPYHYSAVLPFCSLLAICGFWAVWKKLNRKKTIIMIIVLGVALQAYQKGVFEQGLLQLQAVLNKEERTRINDRLYSLHDQNRKANRNAAEWINKNTPENSSIYIWGFEPVIYELSGRKPASRYIYNIPQRCDWSKDAARRELMRELRNNIPSAVIVARNDILEHVTDNKTDSA